MPQYKDSGTNNITRNPVQPTALYPGDQTYLFGTKTLVPGQQQVPTDNDVQFEAVTVGERSISCQLVPRMGGGVAGCIVSIMANGNPGAAEIDVQDSATDADGLYITQTSSTAYKINSWTQIGSSNNYFATAEFQPEGGRFISLKCVANPNAVLFTAKVAYV